jgi:UDP-glucose 4-epimerase
MSQIVVTGGAGFIGSNVVDRLLFEGHSVVVVDNFSTGDDAFLAEASKNERFRIERCDLYTDADRLAAAFDGASAVIHLAANADVRFGWSNPRRDLEQNTIATHNVLEAVRVTGVPRVLFSSTGSVYGEAAVVPTPEDAAFPLQTSLYGASKLAAEGLVQAYVEGAGLSATIFRFVSIMGRRYTHGHVVDFMRKLTQDPTQLEILGDGNQRKSYLHVDDCVEAIVSMLDADHRCEVFNLGVDGYCNVRESASWICERLGLEPELRFTGGDRGWVGDNPFIYLEVAKMRNTGWEPTRTIRQAVEDTVDYLRDNAWVVDRSEVRA